MKPRILICDGPTVLYMGVLAAMEDATETLFAVRTSQRRPPQLMEDLLNVLADSDFDRLPDAVQGMTEAAIVDCERRQRAGELAGMRERAAWLASRVRTFLRRQIVVRLPARVTVQYCWKPGRWKSLT